VRAAPKRARRACPVACAAEELSRELTRALLRSVMPTARPAAAAPLRRAVLSPQKMARLRKQDKGPRGRRRDALFHPRRQAQRRAAGAGPNEAAADAAAQAASRPQPRRSVRVKVCPAPRMRPLVPAKRLVRDGAEDYRAHPSRLMPGHYEGYWAPEKISR
jgi:hypothetical protein